MPDPVAHSGFGVLLFDLLLKGTLLLGIAHLGAWGLRRCEAPAAIHRAGWGLTFLALLLLPLGTLFLPSLPLSEGIEHLSTSSKSTHVPASIETLYSSSRGDQTTVLEEDPREEPTEATERSPADQSSSNDDTWGWAKVLSAIWGIGATVLFLRTAAGQVRIWCLQREGQRIKRPEWTRLVRRLKRKMGLRRAVDVVVHDGIAAPMCAGLVRPVLLLPPAAQNWPVERLRFVLQHEMAHLRRGDLVIGFFARITRALHWPNPLVWTGWNALRHAQELACDEAVMQVCSNFKCYARALVGVARETVQGKTHRRHSAALSLARPARLQRRIVTILRHGPSPRKWSAAAKSIACTVGLGVFLLVAAFRPLPSHLYPVASESNLGMSSPSLIELPDPPTVLAGLGLGGNQGFWSDVSCLEPAPEWQATGRRCWEKGLDTSKVFRNLKTLADMGVAAENLPMGLTQKRFNHAIRHSLVELYRTNPEVVDSLFQRHAAPELTKVELNQDVLGSDKNLSPEVLDTYKEKAYRAITDHYQEPRQVNAPPEIPYPDSLQTRGIGGRIELEGYVNREGEIGAVEVRRGVHPTLNAIAMEAARQATWEPAYLYEKGEKSARPAWVRFPISFSVSN